MLRSTGDNFHKFTFRSGDEHLFDNSNLGKPLVLPVRLEKV